MSQRFINRIGLGLCLVLLGAFLTALAQEPLQGGVSKSWTVDSARQESFRGASMRRDLSQFPAFDPDFDTSQRARIRHLERIGKVYYTFFATGHYSVDPIDKPYAFYYEPAGRLIYVEFDTVKRSYPSKAYKYSYPSGELETTSFSVDYDENYLFNPDGSLLGHWFKQTCYLADGSICGTRWAER